jgi:hypothetical protein
METSCSTCIFFVFEQFKCCRYPPTHDGFPTVNLTDWCGEFREGQTQPSLYTRGTTWLIKSSLPGASLAKLIRHRECLNAVLDTAPSRPDAERIQQLIFDVELEIAERELQQPSPPPALPTLESASKSRLEAVSVCAKAYAKGFTWPREAAELANRGAISNNEWKQIEEFWSDAWESMLLGDKW